MEKILLIAGCSHTAGYEIQDLDDSEFNRSRSYGNILAEKLGRRPINIATGGSTNPTIARDVLEWFQTEYQPGTMDVMVLVGWTSPTRMEVPFFRPTWYSEPNHAADWVSASCVNYLRVNMGWPGGNDDDRKVIPDYQKFMADNVEYMEIISANAVLQLQYFLKMKQVEWLMCNTQRMFTRNKHLSFYMDSIDTSSYFHMENNHMAFFPKFQELGYTNPNAKYLHHGSMPHALFAEELHSFLLG